jgi:hypothetical protein
MSLHFLDLSYRVLDRQVVDANHILCGKVDDIELGGIDDPKITAILIGNGAASGRLPELAKYISRKLFGNGVTRIAWTEVDVIADDIKLKSTAAELGIDERSGFAYSVISRLPLAWKK